MYSRGDLPFSAMFLAEKKLIMPGRDIEEGWRYFNLISVQYTPTNRMGDCIFMRIERGHFPLFVSA